MKSVRIMDGLQKYFIEKNLKEIGKWTGLVLFLTGTGLMVCEYNSELIAMNLLVIAGGVMCLRLRSRW